MADNYTFTQGTGSTGAADEIGGVLYPRVKVTQGVDGVATDVSSAAPMPVLLSSIVTVATHSVTVSSGTITLSSAVQVSSGTITLSSAIQISSGTVTLSSDPAGIQSYIDSSAIGSSAELLLTGYVYDDTGPALLAEGQVGYARVSSGRSQYVQIRDAAGNERGANVDASGRMQVTSTSVTITPSSAVQITPSSAVQITPSSAVQITPSSAVSVGGTVAVSSGTINLLTATSGGWETSHTVCSSNANNVTMVSTQICQMGGVQVFNNGTSPKYLKFANLSTEPTIGTATPVKTFLIPASTSGGAGAGLVSNWDYGVAFSTGIFFWLTNSIISTSTGAVSANEVVVNVDYKK